MTQIMKRFISIPRNRRRLFSSATTVDHQEIEQFQRLTSEWWNEYGPTKGLHSMNKLRVPLIRDGLINKGTALKENVGTSAPLKGLSILDVGCGGGILSEALSRLGAKVTGIDANEQIIEVAKRHAEKSNLHINYQFCSIEDHSKENLEKYDAVAASEIIEHVTEKETFIDNCSKCLKPRGSMFVTTINKTFLANLLAIYVVENIIGLVPKGTHQIEKFIEPHRLQRLLEDYNLRTRLIHGMFYNVATNNWQWCSNTSINYCLHAVKFKEPSS